ncbi:zwei Ig domain protein zig-8-like [Artemia franciscana]|uniref:Ig-like domain-containing protein n=1 Tax=Artemia franciscana TaxID=6661 RepID=A0AA88KWB2_ARTSF|nr:hypothetical protein QYM36_013409 [Artemia franciscana]
MEAATRLRRIYIVFGILWTLTESIVPGARSMIPSFDTSSPVNVTAQVGSYAYLTCRVRNLGNKSVSWIRKSDAHLLAVDKESFIADTRIIVVHSAVHDTWTLQIRGVKSSDTGDYECQVSSEPKISRIVSLSVVVPTIEIKGDPDIYVMAGSSVNLNCVITGYIDEPAFVLWRHHGKETVQTVISSDSTQIRRQPPDVLISSLKISSASHDSAGVYICHPTSLSPTNVTLHVLNGEQPAAMQDGQKSLSPSINGLSLSLSICLLALLLL